MVTAQILLIRPRLGLLHKRPRVSGVGVLRLLFVGQAVVIPHAVDFASERLKRDVGSDLQMTRPDRNTALVYGHDDSMEMEPPFNDWMP